MSRLYVDIAVHAALSQGYHMVYVEVLRDELATDTATTPVHLVDDDGINSSIN